MAGEARTWSDNRLMSGLVDVWAGLHDQTGLELSTVFRAAIGRDLVSPDELQAAVDAAVDC